MENSQMDGWFAHNLTNCLCQLSFWGSACIYGGAKRKMHPFLLLKILFLLLKLPLSFAPVSLLRYVQSVSVVVVTINKLDFESSVWSL